VKLHLWKLRRELLLLWRALLNSRTPLRVRLLIAAALLYAISPFDLIPDWLLGLGWLDDLVLVPLVLAWARRQLPPELAEELAAPDRANG
jgi:uncharacterized membrane protein YkvA (DUF1232 family)